MALMKTEQKYKDVADSYEELESTLTEKKRKLMKILEETAKKLQSSEENVCTEKEHHDYFLKRVQEERMQKEEELKSYVCELNSTLEYVEKEPKNFARQLTPRSTYSTRRSLPSIAYWDRNMRNNAPMTRLATFLSLT